MIRTILLVLSFFLAGVDAGGQEARGREAPGQEARGQDTRGPGTGKEKEVPLFEEVDFRKVKRRLAKEPAYVSDPLYALFLFGPRAEAKVWAVLDKSSPDLAWYDVLYFDRNANGDLTEPGERIAGTHNERGARAGMAMVLNVGRFEVPGTEMVHTDLRFSTIRKIGRKGIYFSMKWKGRVRVSGGAGPTGTNCTIYGKSPETAPILRPTSLGTLSFAFYYGNSLRIGNPSRLSLIIGNPGSGPDTLCTLSDEFLLPGKDRIVAKLIARDGTGKEVVIECTPEKPC